jgi:hypothetical protein
VTVGASDVEVGDAVALESGMAVGLVRGGGDGRVAGVAFVDRDVTTIRVVDVGPTLGDAPGPRLARRGADVLVASYARSGRTRDLRVTSVAPGGEVRPIAVVSENRDDSLAFDVTSGLIAWDEIAGGATAGRGVVRVAALFDDRAGAPRDVSPPSSDAEMPRLVATGAATWVLWLARQPDAPDAAAPAIAATAAVASTGIEATGEARSPTWLEMVAVDAAGSPLGPVRRVTPTTGHVSAYDVRLLRGGSDAAALVVARDDGESIDGSGGALWRVRLAQNGRDTEVAQPAMVPGDGLGRGAPALIEAQGSARSPENGAGHQQGSARSPESGAEHQQGAWLVWAGPNEELRLLPLDATGDPVGFPSTEAALGESWPLVVAGDPAHLLVGVAAARDHSAELRLFSCSRAETVVQAPAIRP